MLLLITIPFHNNATVIIDINIPLNRLLGDVSSEDFSSFAGE